MPSLSSVETSNLLGLDDGRRLGDQPLLLQSLDQVLEVGLLHVELDVGVALVADHPTVSIDTVSRSGQCSRLDHNKVAAVDILGQEVGGGVLLARLGTLDHILNKGLHLCILAVSATCCGNHRRTHAGLLARGRRDDGSDVDGIRHGGELLYGSGVLQRLEVEGSS